MHSYVHASYVHSYIPPTHTASASGFHLNAVGRTALMERLARGAEGINIPQPVAPGMWGYWGCPSGEGLFPRGEGLFPSGEGLCPRGQGLVPRGEGCPVVCKNVFTHTNSILWYLEDVRMVVNVVGFHPHTSTHIHTHPHKSTHIHATVQHIHYDTMLQHTVFTILW